MTVDGSKLSFSTARVIAIYGSFKHNDDLYIFRRVYSHGVFAYTTVDARKIILIKDKL